MIFNQIFSLEDIPKVFFLSFIEIALSADNAIVLGLLTARLPEHLRKKALYIGSLSALVIRAFALFGVALLIQYQWVQIIGAIYLLYLSFSYFFKKKKTAQKTQGKDQFWRTVIFIEVFDLLFAIDSILAGIAFVGLQGGTFLFSKIWIVYLGGVIGLLAIRYAAHWFSIFVHRFAKMERQAYLMIGWIGLKLGYEILPHSKMIVDPIFWSVLILLFCLGFIKEKKQHG